MTAALQVPSGACEKQATLNATQKPGHPRRPVPVVGMLRPPGCDGSVPADTPSPSSSSRLSAGAAASSASGHSRATFSHNAHGPINGASSIIGNGRLLLLNGALGSGAAPYTPRDATNNS